MKMDKELMNKWELADKEVTRNIGCTLHECRVLKNGDHYVFCHWEGKYQPWVVWRVGEYGGLYNGNYFTKKEDAYAYFDKKCKSINEGR